MVAINPDLCLGIFVAAESVFPVVWAVDVSSQFFILTVIFSLAF